MRMRIARRGAGYALLRVGEELYGYRDSQHSASADICGRPLVRTGAYGSRAGDFRTCRRLVHLKQ